MLKHENTLWSAGFNLIAGVDEAGRGPLAGPVVAAAVVIPRTLLEAEAQGALRTLTDSKQLTPRQRRHFYDWLQSTPGVLIGVGVADVSEIDAINILQATCRAMCRALEALPCKPERALVDGRPVPHLPCPSTAVVKGDCQSLLIAAASVIAKVTRDANMDSLDRRHPEYGFAQHKGYGTARHVQAMLKHGCLKEHRRSFRPVREVEEIRARSHIHENGGHCKISQPRRTNDCRTRQNNNQRAPDNCGCGPVG